MNIQTVLLTVIILLLAGLNQTAFAQGSPNVPLLIQVNDYPSAGYNDCWGYTDPNGREYALLGVASGTSIIDITDTNNPLEIAFIPSTNSIWKDIKTYQQYAYVVNESGGGLQIIDLSDLPNSAVLAGTYNGFNTSHNLYIDEPNAILYAEGSFSEPVRTISLADPLNPVQISTFGIECHDIYTQNNIAFISEGGSGSIGLFDMSIPGSPTLLHRLNIPASGYVHNAWASQDGQFLMTTEETTGKTIKLWDISNLGNITMTGQILGPGGLAHNTHIKGNFAYVSHYTDGLRIYDIADPFNIFEAGFYDTYSGGSGFNGAWGAFPFFASGKILISDIQTGLYVVFFQGSVEGDPNDPKPPTNIAAYSDYTTPNTISLSWDDPVNFFNGDTLLASQFTIEIERDGLAIASIPGGTGQFNDTGLNDGQLYAYGLFTNVTATDSTSDIRTVEWYSGGSPVPAPPESLACSATVTEAQLNWNDPTTQSDGTPLDDLERINIYRNGALVANVAPGIQTFSDTPPGGFSYTYTVKAQDNEIPPNESGPSNAVDCFVGTTPQILVWVGANAAGASAQSGDSLFAALVANGQSVLLTNNLFEFGNDLSIYQAVFVVLGIYSNNHVLGASDPEAAALETYIANGGRIYLEGGDCFNFDPETGGYNIRPWFDVLDGPDGSNDLFGALGINDLSAFTFPYTGDNNWIDELQPVSSYPIFQNDQNTDLTAVYNPAYLNGGRSIGASFSFGGLVNTSSPLNPDLRVVNPSPDKLWVDQGETNVLKSAPVRKDNPHFVKKAAYYPELKTHRRPSGQLYQLDANGSVEILANNKVDLMAAYLGLLGLTSVNAIISTHPDSLIFGAVQINQQASQTLTVLNSGNEDLTVTNITATHNFFTLNVSQFTVFPNDSFEVTVTYSPLTAGAHTGFLEIFSNDPFSPVFSVYVEGSADDPQGIEDAQLPQTFAVSPNYPNPFNPSTSIKYQLPHAGEVTLIIYNMLGQKIQTLVNGFREPGYYQVSWDGRSESGTQVGSGIYIYKFTADHFQKVRKMILMK